MSTLTLRKFDEVQIEGIHPRNPITDEEILAFNQSFVVTRDQNGEALNPSDLSPACHESGPIPLGRILVVNGAAVRP